MAKSESGSRVTDDIARWTQTHDHSTMPGAMLMRSGPEDDVGATICSTLRPRPVQFKAAIAATLRETVRPLMSDTVQLMPGHAELDHVAPYRPVDKRERRRAFADVLEVDSVNTLSISCACQLRSEESPMYLHQEGCIYIRRAYGIISSEMGQ